MSKRALSTTINLRCSTPCDRFSCSRGCGSPVCFHVEWYRKCSGSKGYPWWFWTHVYSRAVGGARSDYPARRQSSGGEKWGGEKSGEHFTLTTPVMKKRLHCGQEEYSGQDHVNKLKSCIIIATVAWNKGSPALRKEMRSIIKMSLSISTPTKWSR